ncbi:hypothetical protein BOX15_Mlig000544g2 [Macrostomum lignano]|uniref:Death domain-containing protein n=1 Tax=Macrostomum lignano TaxID=282301 RepID=A0A267FAX7_9PLAT|nr:hypothetical protein BOX15_Mlig000544g2 [Macrostomum lignano]
MAALNPGSLSHAAGSNKEKNCKAGRSKAELSSSTLSLRGLRLTQLPPLPRLHCLVRLDLSHNRLADLPDSWPADAPGQSLPLLQELLVSHNRLNRVPAWFAALDGLRLLDLSHNRLRRYPRELLRLPRLSRLLLNGNPIINLSSESRGFDSACSRRPLTDRQQQQIGQDYSTSYQDCLATTSGQTVGQGIRLGTNPESLIPKVDSKKFRLKNRPQANVSTASKTAFPAMRTSSGAALKASIAASSTSGVTSTTSGVASTISGVTSTTSGVTSTTSGVTSKVYSVSSIASGAGRECTTSGTASTTSGVASTTSGVAYTTSGVACTTSGTASTTSDVASRTSSVASTTSGVASSTSGAALSASNSSNRPPRLRDLLSPSCPAVGLLNRVESSSAAEIDWQTQQTAKADSDSSLVVVGLLAALLPRPSEVSSDALRLLPDKLAPKLRPAADLTLASPPARLLAPALALQLPLGVAARRRRDYVVCIGHIADAAVESSGSIRWRPLDSEFVRVRVADGGLRVTVSAADSGRLLAPAAYCALAVASAPEAAVLLSPDSSVQAVLSDVPGQPRLEFPAGCVQWTAESPCRAVLRCPLYAKDSTAKEEAEAFELAAPIVECLPHQLAFCRPVTLCLPLPHCSELFERFGLRPETDLSLWHSDTTGSEPPVWHRLDAPFSVVKSSAGNADVSLELRVQLTRFCLIRAVWSRLAGAIRRAKLGAAAVYPSAATAAAAGAYRMRCAVYAQPAAGAGFTLEVLLHRADRPAPNAVGGRVCVGAALLDRPVPPGRICVRLLSEQFEADPGAGEAPQLAKTETDFSGQAFDKVFACRYRRLGKTSDGGSGGGGVFGRVLVEGDSASEPLFDLTLARPPPAARPTASRKRARRRHCCCDKRRRQQRRRIRLARRCCCFGDVDDDDDDEDNDVSTSTASTTTSATTSSATEKLAPSGKRRCRRDEAIVEGSDGGGGAAVPPAADASASRRLRRPPPPPSSPCPDEPDEFAMWEAAEPASTRWRVLARALRLSSAEVARVESRWGHDAREAAFQCLLRWFESSEQPTCGAAGAALIKAGLRVAARRLCVAHRGAEAPQWNC